MSDHAQLFGIMTLAMVLGCDSTLGEPADTDSSGSGSETSTTTNSQPTSAQTTNTPIDPTADSSGDDSTTGPVQTPPELEVAIEGRSVSNGGSYELAEPVATDSDSAVITVELQNVGGSTLSINAVYVEPEDTAHFTLDDTGLEPMVDLGGSTSVDVIVAPANGGAKSTQLLIESDDVDDSPYTITLSARTPANTYRDLQPATLPAGRFNVGLAATDDGRVLLFGGRLADGSRGSDTWLFDVEAGDWTELSPAMSPSARDALAMAYLADGMFVLFGGTETSGPEETPVDDTWIFDLATEQWTPVMPAISPPARYQHRMVSAGDGLALAYGGRPDFGLEFSDTWLFDLATEQWTDLAPPTNPGPRSAFALAFDGDNAVALVGGNTNSVDLTDETWIYDLAGNEWTQVAAAGAGPQFNNVAAWLGTTLVSTSGKLTCCTEPVPGTWAYDAVADTWTEITPKSEPAPRFSHRMVPVGEQKAIIFGGLLLNAGPASAVSETWEYVGPQ
ncbi:MAG: kelch repeat-containing protein [Myxococcota bacterium]